MVYCGGRIASATNNTTINKVVYPLRPSPHHRSEVSEKGKTSTAASSQAKHKPRLKSSCHDEGRMGTKVYCMRVASLGMWTPSEARKG